MHNFFSSFKSSLIFKLLLLFYYILLVIYVVGPYARIWEKNLYGIHWRVTIQESYIEFIEEFPAHQEEEAQARVYYNLAKETSI
jgi:hypothetical protein